MKCLNCNAVLTVHIAGSDGMSWYRRHYCENCGRPRVSGYRPRCAECETHFDEFLATGLLGCAHCYDSFAPEMEPLLEKYRGGLTPGNHGVSYVPERIARARTREVAQALGLVPPLELGDHVPEEQPPSNAVLPNFGADAGMEMGAEPGTSAEGGPTSKSDGNGNGDFSSPVFKSFRLRAARNLQGIPYPGTLGSERFEILCNHLLGERAGAALTLGDAESVGEDEPAASVRRERRFPESNLRLYTGDEDQLRAEWTIALEHQCDFDRELSRILKELEELDRLYEWQFHPVHGYLTTCPASSGSGLRASFLMEVPALTSAGLWPVWKHELREAGFECRGSGGEGSAEENGAQISNRAWLPGTNVPEAVRAMLVVLRRLEQAELEQRRISSLDQRT